MEYVISPIWAIMETLCMFMFLDSQLPRRLNKSKHVLGTIAWCIVINILVAFGLGGFIKQIVVIGATLIMSFVFYRGSWVRHVLCVILIFVLLGVIDIAATYGVCAILKISYSEFVWKKLQYVVTVTVAKLVSLLFTYLLRHFRKSNSMQTIRTKWLLLMLLFPAACFSSIVVFFVSYRNQADIPLGVFVYICILEVTNIAILYLIQMMEKQSYKERQMILVNQQIEVQTKNIIALERSYRNQRQASHEFMHQLQTIADLLDRDEKETAQNYIFSIQGTQKTRTFAVNTHHPILDVVLNQKYQVACEQATEMQFHVNDLSKIQIQTNELVVVFSNLLDNALEACLKLPDNRRINCSVIQEEGLFISIRNTSPEIEFVDGYPETAKEPKAEHGFGLKSVCYILDGLQAEYTFEYNDGYFQFVTEIPLKAKE